MQEVRKNQKCLENVILGNVKSLWTKVSFEAYFSSYKQFDFIEKH